MAIVYWLVCRQCWCITETIFHERDLHKQEISLEKVEYSEPARKIRAGFKVIGPLLWLQLVYKKFFICEWDFRDRNVTTYRKSKHESLISANNNVKNDHLVNTPDILLRQLYIKPGFKKCCKDYIGIIIKSM